MSSKVLDNLAGQHLPRWWRELSYANQTSWGESEDWADYSPEHDDGIMDEFKTWVEENPVEEVGGPSAANLATSRAADSGNWLEKFGKAWASKTAHVEDAADDWWKNFRQKEMEREALGYVSNDLRAPLDTEPVGGWHYPLIDLDHDAALIESSSRGHHHLYINKALTWGQYLHVLSAMADVGLVQKGFYEATKIRGYSSLRLPWVKKGEEQ